MTLKKTLLSVIVLFFLCRCGNPADHSIEDNTLTRLLSASNDKRKQKLEQCLANETEADELYKKTISNRDVFIKKLTDGHFFDKDERYLLAEEYAAYEETRVYDAFIVAQGEKLRVYKFALSNDQELAFGEVDLASARVPVSYTLGGKPDFSNVKLDAPLTDFIRQLDLYRSEIPCSVYSDQLFIYSLTSFSKNEVHWTNSYINHLNCFDKHYKFDCDNILNDDDSRTLLENLDNLFFYVGAN